jgi:valine dehydrogenase (NAD+)
VEGTFARFQGHEQVVFASDEAAGLRAIIAVHSTRLGPSLGGTRFHPYPDDEAALTDVLRLSRAMTYKAACAGLDLGGGKAVIIGDPATVRSEALLRAFGRAVDWLGGRYITACDVGTTPRDMAIIRRETRNVTGLDTEDGGSGDSGIATAHGVHLSMRAAAGVAFGEPTLQGRHVAVQGLGKVGARLVRALVEEGAKLTVADVDADAVGRVEDLPGVEVVGVEQVLYADADVVSPNALGAVLTEATIPRLQARIVCGAANNQLGVDEDADRLRERGILYCPDYVVNAGGLINVADELHDGGYRHDRALRRVEHIPDNLTRILELAREEDITTEAAAEEIAERRIAAVGGLRRWHG